MGAYDLASNEAYGIANRIAESIKEDVANGEVDDLSDRIHEDCDSAVIYTHDCYTLAWGLPDGGDYEDLVGDSKDFGRCLTTRAYCNLYARVSELVGA